MEPERTMARERARELVPALIPQLPEDLQALVFHRRPATGPCRRLWAGGDVGFSGRLAPLADDPGAGPFEEIAPALATGDLAFANLETPLVPQRREGDLFAAPPAAARRLAAAGFGLLNLANNHIRDYGPEGLEATRRALREAGIRTLGAGDDEARAREPAVLELEDLSVAWLGCARTLQSQEAPGARFWELDGKTLPAAVEEAARSADLVAVSLHLGYMFIDYPHPDHRRLALDLAEAGAHLVLMHHAHVLQGVEVAPGGAVICYNLGNLLFDWTEGEVPGRLEIEHQRSGALFAFDLDAEGVACAFALPLRVADDGSLRWARGGEGEAVLERLERISRCWPLAGEGEDSPRGGFEEEFWRQRARRNTGQTLETLGHKLRQGELGVLWEGARRLRPHHLGMLWRWVGSRLGQRQGAPR